MSGLDDKPNIKRIYIALTEGGLCTKYTPEKCGIDLSEAFFQFIIEEEFEDDQIPEEFGDDGAEESFFADWLTTNKEMDESAAKSIWSDLNLANKGIYDPPEQKQNIDEDFKSLYLNYNIEIRDKDLENIKQQLKLQCADLMPDSKSDNQIDKATYAIIQIGKQNNNQPLLMYLVDAHNRYRIQKRKKLMNKLINQGYNEQETQTIFGQQFEDIDAGPFIKKKCKGIPKWLNEYNDRQRKQFIEMCQAAATVFPRRLLHKPPMYPRTALVNDSSVKICEYIFQTYQFIEEFMQVKNYAPIPAQIDVIIIPKQYKVINWDDDDYDYQDDDSDNENEEKDIKTVPIGDINKRLTNIKNKLPCTEIESGTANRTLLQSVNTLLKGKRNQRVIVMIDRRGKTDKCYGFQTNSDDEKRSDCFESNRGNLINEALIQKMRLCILPKIGKERKNISINTQKPFGLTFSFQCFSANEIRVYLCNNGWGMRFFIEDVKYFLPIFFVDEQQKLLEKEFGKKDQLFQSKYAKCKNKCPDERFEAFYTSLFDDQNHKSH